MSGVYLNDYFNNLTSQISASVDRLKTKQGQTAAPNPFAPETESETAGAFQLSAQSYRLLDSKMSYQLALEDSKAQNNFSGSGYAAESYLKTSRVNQPSTVLVDFMFAGNREFDFKV